MMSVTVCSELSVKEMIAAEYRLTYKLQKEKVHMSTNYHTFEHILAHMRKYYHTLARQVAHI